MTFSLSESICILPSICVIGAPKGRWRNSGLTLTAEGCPSDRKKKWELSVQMKAMVAVLIHMPSLRVGLDFWEWHSGEERQQCRWAHTDPLLNNLDLCPIEFAISSTRKKDLEFTMKKTNLTTKRPCTTKSVEVKAKGNITIVPVEELLFWKGKHTWFSFLHRKTDRSFGSLANLAYCASAQNQKDMPKRVVVRQPANTKLSQEIMTGKHAIGVQVVQPRTIIVVNNGLASAIEALRATYQGYIDNQLKTRGSSRFKNIPSSMSSNFSYAILHTIRHGLANPTAVQIFSMGNKNQQHIMKTVTKNTAPNLKKPIRRGANSYAK